MPEKIPKEYDAIAFERIINSLEKKIDALQTGKLKRIKSVSGDAAANLRINEPGYVLQDSQDCDFVFRAEDGRLYRITGVAATPSSTSSSGGTTDHSTLSNLSYATSGHTGFVSDAGDTITGAITIDGSADAVQLTIQGNATQTSSLLVLEDSAGNDQVTVSNDGAVVINEEGNSGGDLRAEGDTEANLLFVDASDDAAYIGGSATGKIGFHKSTGAVARSTGWSVSNVTSDKSFDADATSIDEIADVLGTLLTFLLSRGDLGA